MTILYRISMAFYLTGIRLSAFMGNAKAKLWLHGRQGLMEKLSRLPAGENRVWFHCASLGEFEQGRPVLEKFKMKNSNCKIVLTFFSPSGFEVRKNYAGADYVFYLPLDGARHARVFMDCVTPVAAFFVKYDFWYFFLRELKQRGIPIYSISCVFRPEHIFFKWYGAFFRRTLRCITRFFVQDEKSGKLLGSIGLTNVTVSGDTRFDRVQQVAAEASEIVPIRLFAHDAVVLVAGSTWPGDEKLIAELLPTVPGLKVIIAPHEVTSGRIQDLTNRFSSSVCFSKASMDTMGHSRVLIIDSIGLLSTVYRYGNYAYVGGGFGKGIHNILEAAVYGLPVFFGPNFQKFIEARELVEKGGAYSIASAKEMTDIFQELLRQPQKYSIASEVSAGYVKEKAGATEKILAAIQPLVQ